MITGSDWSVRQRQWAEYHRWASTEAPRKNAPEHSIADLGTILEWIPPSVLAEERDPDRRGVQRMHALLRLLKSE